MAETPQKPAVIPFSPFNLQFPQQTITPEQAFQFAVANPTIPRFYVTNFTNVVGSTELSMLLGYHGSASAIVSMSYPLAKTLADKLGQAIKEYETATSSTVVDAEALGKNFPQK